MRPAARDREGISSLAAAFAPECRRRVSSKHLITSPRRGLASSAGGDGGAASEAALNLLLGNCTQNRSQCCRSGCPGVRKNESLGDLHSNKQPYLGTLCACAALESPARQILVALFKAVLWVRLRRCWPEIWLRLLRKNPNPSPHTRILEYSTSRSASIAAFSLCAARQASSDPVASAASAQRRAAHPYDAFAHCFVQELCIAESREPRVRAASCIAHRHLPLAVSAHS